MHLYKYPNPMMNKNFLIRIQGYGNEVPPGAMYCRVVDAIYGIELLNFKWQPHFTFATKEIHT